MPEDLIRLNIVGDATSVTGALKEASASTFQFDTLLKSLGTSGVKAGEQISVGMKKADYSMMEARHTAMLATEEIGVKMPRAVSSLIASIGPLGAIMAAAFPIIGALALIDVLSQVADKFEGMDKKAREADLEWSKSNLSMLDSQNKLRESVDRTMVSIQKIQTPGPVGELRALGAEMDRLSHSASDLGGSLQDLLEKGSLTVDKQSTWIDRWGPMLQKISSVYFAGFGDSGNKVNEMLKHMQDTAVATSAEMLNFGERIHIITTAWGNTAGLKAVDAELNRVYEDLQKTPNDRPLQHFKDQLEGIQRTLSLKTESEYWDRQKVGAEATAVKAKMLLDVYLTIQKLKADALKQEDEQIKESAKIMDFWLKHQLDGELKISEAKIKAYDAQLTLNAAIAKGAAETQGDLVLRDRATGSLKALIADEATYVKLLQDQKTADLAIVDAKIAQEQAAMDAAITSGPGGGLNEADYNNALAKFREYEAQRVLIAANADKQIADADTKMLAKEDAALRTVLNKMSGEFASFFAQVLTGHETLGKAAMKLYDQMAESFIKNLLKSLAMETIAHIQHKALLKDDQLAEAKTAAASAWKSLAGIPIIGPELGAIAAAMVFAGAMAFSKGGVVPSAQFGMTAPNGDASGTMALLHPNEMVLDAPLSQTIQDLAHSASGSRGGSSGDIHIHAMDAKSFTDFLKRNPGALGAGIQHAADRGHVNLPRITRGK